MRPRRLAITGTGIFSCFGVGSEAFWNGLLSGPPSDAELSLRTVDRDLLSQTFNDRRSERRLDPGVVLALVGAESALRDAGEHGVPPERRGVFLGSTMVALKTLERDFPIVLERDGEGLSAHNQPMIMANAAPANFAIRNDFQGPSQYVSNACASGNTAIHLAVLHLRSGLCDLAVAGGWEGTGRRMVVTSVWRIGIPSPSGVSRPFDKRHDGVVMGEGSAAVAIEDWDNAVARGANILGEVLGVATNCDAIHISSPDPSGESQARCMRAAIADAGLSPSDITLVSAHGNATPYNDDAEAMALKKTFGSNAPPIFSTKGATGHTWASAGPIGVIALLEAARHRIIPPTWGFEVPSDAAQDLTIYKECEKFSPGPMMSNAFGFGGHNVSVIVKPGPG